MTVLMAGQVLIVKCHVQEKLVMVMVNVSKIFVCVIPITRVNTVKPRNSPTVDLSSC